MTEHCGLHSWSVSIFLPPHFSALIHWFRPKAGLSHPGFDSFCSDRGPIRPVRSLPVFRAFRFDEPRGDFTAAAQASPFQ